MLFAPVRFGGCSMQRANLLRRRREDLVILAETVRPSARMKPLGQQEGTTGDTRKSSRAKQDARELRPAVSIPPVNSSSGLRRARRRRRRRFAGGRFAHHLL